VESDVVSRPVLVVIVGDFMFYVVAG
jgi:hypothetical protein